MGTEHELERTVAAVDLGSNSFHMVVARVDGDRVILVDRIRERVQIAAGLSRKGRLSKDARERALACLEKFGQRIRHLPASDVRAVGTNTLRATKNAEEFLVEAETALGHSIDVISGIEEARLVYRGVTQTQPSDVQKRLVIDIGGGSTECILGDGDEIVLADSMHMGCVTWSKRFFEDGRIDANALHAAEIAAALELRSIRYRYRDTGWEGCVGSSGTINAISEILRECGWSSSGITNKGLSKLRKAMIAAGNSSELHLPGLSRERASVLPGGFCVLAALFDSLKVKRMMPSSAALREGLIYDLLGRRGGVDVRESTILAFASRVGVDEAQADRVQRLSLWLLEQVAKDWDLDVSRAAPYLRWASRLHEAGLAFSHTKYHRHGAYLVAHADLAGFSKDEQGVLAALIGLHRRRPQPEYWEGLRGREKRFTLRLASLLRLAVRLNRNRSDKPELKLSFSASKNKLNLQFLPGWFQTHPLTEADLREEAKALRQMDFQLSYGCEAGRDRG